MNEYSTSGLAAIAGYSVQQVRDLGDLGVLPPARRMANGYRRFGAEHATALNAYRNLAAAVGPVEARSTMQAVRSLPRDEAVARIVALHTRLARAREEALEALRMLGGIVNEIGTESTPEPTDAMSITELAGAIGVRSSTLRFWEQEGLVTPERDPRSNIRSYPPAAAREARIVAALRAGGYRIPAIREILVPIRQFGDVGQATDVLRKRLQSITVQSEAMIRASADILDLIPAPPQ